MRAPLAQTLALSRMRLLLIMRQSEIVFWIFAFPVVLIVVLGFAFRSSGPVDSPVGLVRTPAADALANQLAAEPGLDVRRFDSDDAARVALRSGVIDVLVEPGSPPVLWLQPARPEAETARLRVLRTLELGPPDERAAAAQVEPVDETGSRYIDFLLPGLIGLNLYSTGLWAIGFGVADARRKKLLRRYLVTPMRKSAYLASFLTFRVIFLVFELLLIGGFGVWILGVPLLGSLALFGFVSLLGAVCYAGIGLLAVSRVKTIEGASGMINIATIPVWLGSGVFFSYERFPDAVQPVLRALPLTPLNDALRDIMLDGAGLAAVLPDLGLVLAWGIVSFALALSIFRWE